MPSKLSLCMILLFLVICTGLASVDTQVLPTPFQRCSNAVSSNDTKSKMIAKSCPPWTYRHRPNSTTCQCGDTMDHILECNNATVELSTCHCMSYNKEHDMVLMGTCPYLCTNRYYIDIPCNVDELDTLCQMLDFNRTGQFCGECKGETAPAAYSYVPVCVECSSHDWIKYVVVAYLPLTVFYVVVVFFRINAMSPSLNTYIFVSQLLVCRAVTSALITYVRSSLKHPVYSAESMNVGMGIVFTSYSIWNLDFFRYLYRPFCLHRKASTVGIIALDYAIAVYPLALILITYGMVKLHDRMKVVQIIWKPASWLFSRLNKDKGIRTSLIEAFGTFFLLSYVKIVNTSVDLLMSVKAHNATGHVVGRFLYYDGSMEFFGPKHMPYAMLAIFMFVVFSCLPFLLLCLYPCGCTQSCLNCCGLNSHVLRTFMDAFQGCYKFEPYDCRYYSGFYLLLRMAFLWNFNINKSPYFVIISGVFIIPIVAIIFLLKPYKNNFYNMMDVIFFLVLLMFTYSVTTIPLTSFDEHYLPYSVVMCLIAVAFPPLYVLVLIVYTLLPTSVIVLARRCFQNCIHRVVRRKDEAFEPDMDEGSLLLARDSSEVSY